MNHSLIISALLLTACGSYNDTITADPINYGTVEQPVYMPGGYGIEGLNASNCNGHPDCGMQCAGFLPQEVAGNACVVPNSKIIKLSWSPSSCNNDWDQRMFSAITLFTNDMFLAGWSVINGTDYSVKCAAISGTGALGRFMPGPEWDILATSYGSLFQHKNGKVEIDTADADAFCAFAVLPAANAQCKENLIYHELSHLAGFGHSKKGSGDDLMSESPNGTWVNQKTWGTTRFNMVDCYNPDNGGLFDDC